MLDFSRLLFLPGVKPKVSSEFFFVLINVGNFWQVTNLRSNCSFNPNHSVIKNLNI